MSAMIEPFFTCLIASMIWAPIVFLATARFRKGDSLGLAEKIWPAALAIAALPAMIAPLAATFGFSLRSAPAIPPMNALPLTPAIALEAAPIASAATTISASSMLDALAVLYFYGFFMFLVLGVARYIWFSYRVGYAFEVDEPRLTSGLEAWRQQIGIKRRPRYAFSDAVASVCVHGFFRPVILMPYNLLDRVSVDDAVLMGAHEMAHIKRGDTSLFAFCTIVKAVFWFNPFMQHIAARANLAAEQAADALVIARGVDRRQYAHCFVRGLRFAAGANHTAGQELVPSFTPFDKRSRRERLDAILSGTRGAALLSLRGKIGLALSVGVAAALAFAQAALAVAPPPAEDALPQSPVDGVVSFSFSQTSELLRGDRKEHEGVDIKARRGTAVKAAGDGKVIAATRRYQGKRAWGKVVVIDHGHGLVTRYAHLDSFEVKKGDRVSAGDIIGAVGSTGKSTGPHLHFEVIQDGLHIDPAPVVAVAQPMPAPAPVLSPIPDAKPVIVLKPAPETAEMPKATMRVRSVKRIDDKLAGRFANFEVRIAEVVKDVRPFEGFEFEGPMLELDDIDFENISELQAFAMNGVEMVRNIEMLSEEDREEIRDAQRQARHEVERVRQQVARNQERAQRQVERAQRDIERAQIHRQREQENHAHAEALREHAREQAERAEEQQERAREQIEQAEEQQERAREQIEQAEEQQERAREQRERAAEEIERARESAMEQVENREEMLALREEALADARADLEEELAEIERMRAELKREKRARKNK